MLTRLETEGLGPADHLRLDCAPRLNLITGDNGLGKSFLLDLAWWVCARDWPDEVAVPRPDRMNDARIAADLCGAHGETFTKRFGFDAGRARWRQEGGARPVKPGLVLYARVDGGYSVWDPARHYFRASAAEKRQGSEQTSAFHFRNDEIWLGKQDDLGHQISNGLFEDWVYWQAREPEVFAAFERVLAHLSTDVEPLRPTDAPIRLPGPSVRRLPGLQTAYGDIPICHGSAGVRRVVCLAYLLVWTWREHQAAAEAAGQPAADRLFVIVDEIEAHLHPRWQRVILPALLVVAEVLDMAVATQFMVSTHSPLVMASAEEDFDAARDRLFHLELRQNQVRLEAMDWAPHGEVGNWLASEVFGLREPRSREAEKVLVAVEDMMAGRTGDVPDQWRAPEELEGAMRATLPPLDPVWARWRFFRQRSA